MLESIHIQNFRGIRDLTIGDFSAVNVFVGTNGCGKTSVLEAIGTFLRPKEPWFLSLLSFWRRMGSATEKSPLPLRAIFCDLRVVNPDPMQLEGRLDGVDDVLTIEPITALPTVGQTNGNLAMNAVQLPHFERLLAGVRFRYRHGQDPEVRTDSLLREAGMGAEAISRGLEPLRCFYVPAQVVLGAELLGRFILSVNKRKTEAQLTEFVQVVEPRVRDLRAGGIEGETVVLADVGATQRLPVQLLGDGFMRACSMAAGIFDGNYREIVIDEIENGLHFSVMPQFWSALGALCRKYPPRQLFCSTHSEEMLHYVVAAFTGHPDELKVFRIDRGNDGTTTATAYRHEELQLSDEIHIEVR